MIAITRLDPVNLVNRKYGGICTLSRGLDYTWYSIHSKKGGLPFLRLENRRRLFSRVLRIFGGAGTWGLGAGSARDSQLLVGHSEFRPKRRDFPLMSGFLHDEVGGIVTALVTGLMLATPEPQRSQAFQILMKVLSNILEHDAVVKFRTLKTSNKAIQQKRLAVDGARDVLIAVGFVDTGDALVLPPTASLDKLRSGLVAVTENLPALHLESKTVRTPPKSGAGSRAKTAKTSAAHQKHQAQLLAERKAKQAERDGIKKQLALDKAERAQRPRPTKASQANKTHFGMKNATFADIGVRLPFCSLVFIISFHPAVCAGQGFRVAGHVAYIRFHRLAIGLTMLMGLCSLHFGRCP